MQISLASKTKKHDPTYYVTVKTSSTSSSALSTSQISAPFTTWFTADGYFVALPFQKWLASSVRLIGDADSKNAGSETSPATTSAGVAANGTPGSSRVDGAGKGSKRSKRKA